MTTIRFRFEPEKLAQALAYIASRGVRDLTKLKAMKLLFFADKLHLQRFARPITGDEYYCMQYGPVPTNSLNVVNDLIANDPAEPPLRILSEYVSVDYTGAYPILRAARPDIDFDMLSQSDVQVLDEILAAYGNRSAAQLVDESHRNSIYKTADKERTTGSAPMPYESFLQGPELAMIRESVRGAQEIRDMEDEIDFAIAMRRSR